jgi:ferredoxin, 2Fe-2S
MQVTYLAHDGTRTTLTLAKGDTVMLAAVHAGVAGIEGQCGGLLSCATCHVYVDPAWADKLPPPSSDETAMLEFAAAALKPTSRLACQLTYVPGLDGLVVDLPDLQS